MATTQREQRSSKRVKAKDKVEVKVGNGAVHNAQAQLRDVSLRGVYMYLQNRVAKGSTLEVVLPLPAGILAAVKRNTVADYAVMGNWPAAYPYARMAAAVLDANTLPEELRRVIDDKAEGNPFYLEQLARSAGASTSGPVPPERQARVDEVREHVAVRPARAVGWRVPLVVAQALAHTAHHEPPQQKRENGPQQQERHLQEKRIGQKLHSSLQYQSKKVLPKKKATIAMLPRNTPKGIS